jgi:hypothetical protein
MHGQNLQSIHKAVTKSKPGHLSLENGSMTSQVQIISNNS